MRLPTNTSVPSGYIYVTVTLLPTTTFYIIIPTKPIDSAVVGLWVLFYIAQSLFTN